MAGEAALVDLPDGQSSLSPGPEKMDPPRERVSDVTGLPRVHVQALDEPDLSVLKLNDLFRASTGLDLFLCHNDPPSGEPQERALSDEIRMPRFCQLVRDTPQGLRRCTACHEEMMKKAVQCPKVFCQRCHAGLVTVHLPVITEGGAPADIQTVCALDRRYEPGECGSLREAIADLGLPKKRLFEAIADLQVVSEPKAQYVLRWLDLAASLLSPPPHRPDQGEGGKHLSALAAEPYSVGVPVEERVRREIARFVALPPYRANRSCGCSASLIGRVTAFLKQSFSLPLSTQLVALALGFEPSYFSKNYKRFAGQSMSRHLREIRLQRAKQILRNPYLSIQEVADRTGFSDASYFTRVFHHDFGITPTQYRNILKDVV